MPVAQSCCRSARCRRPNRSILHTFAGLAAGWLIAIAPGATWGQDPFSDPSAGATWSSPAGVLGTLPEKNSAVVYASYPGTALAFGKDSIQVVECSTGTELGTVPVELAYSSTIAALSPDGSVLAVAVPGEGGGRSQALAVFDVKTGKESLRLSASDQTFKDIKYLEFTKHGYLVLVGEGGKGSVVQVLRVPEGTAVSSFFIDRVNTIRGRIAVSTDGRHMAVAYYEGLLVFDIVSGKTVARMSKPPSDSGVNPLSFVEGMAFSPDGTELAVLVSIGKKRLIVFNVRGEVVEDFGLGSQLSVTQLQGDAVQWSPDGQSWLLMGSRLVDRRAKTTVWKLERRGFVTVGGRFLDAGHVVAGRSSGNTEDIVVIDIPRQAIDQSVAAMTGQNVRFGPGAKVQVNVTVDSVSGGSASEIETALRETAEKRLSENDLVIEPSADAALTINYSEAAGEQLRIVEGSFISGRDTGQRVQETVGTLTGRLTINGGSETLWEQSIRKGNPHHVNAETVNAQTVREEMFKRITYLVSTLDIPYFVAGDADIASLPIAESTD